MKEKIMKLAEDMAVAMAGNKNAEALINARFELENAITQIINDAKRAEYMLNSGYSIHEQQFKGGKRYSIGPVFTNYSREWFSTKEEAIDSAIKGIQ